MTGTFTALDTGGIAIATEFDEGMLVGLLVGEGHFGGDGRQPQITLRMHVRHEAMFNWLEHCFPGGRLYGPYHHGGRHYYQWMARGSYLRDFLVPLLEQRLAPELDGYAHQRFQDMRERYARQLAGGGERTLPGAGSESVLPRPESSGAAPPAPISRSRSKAGSTEEASEEATSPGAATIFEQLRRNQSP